MRSWYVAIGFSMSLSLGQTAHAWDFPDSIVESEWAEEMNMACEATHRAGSFLYAFQRTDEPLQVEQKAGYKGILSPVSYADKKSNAMICTLLHERFPAYGILTEEEVADESLQEATRSWRSAERTWIIDPLDGTKAFINKKKDYGIHIGLTMQGEPVLGLNYFPETDTLYYAIKGCGSYKQIGSDPAQAIHTPLPSAELLPLRNTNPEETRAIYEELLQQPLTPALIEELFPVVGSCGLRICLVAEGIRSVYISTGIRGGLWDYCSSDVIIKEAGGLLTDLDGNAIDYRDSDARLQNGSIVTHNPTLHEKIIRIHRALVENEQKAASRASSQKFDLVSN